MDKFEQMTNREMRLIDNAEARVERELHQGQPKHREGDVLIHALELLDHLETQKLKLEQRDVAREQTRFSDRVAAIITRFAGSVPFFIIHVCIFAIWISINLFPQQIGIKPFDPFPFMFLTLTVSLEAILLSTFILITQNRLSRQDARRDEIDFERDRLDLKVDTVAAVNTREATLRIMRIERRLDSIDEKMDALLKRRR